MFRFFLIPRYQALVLIQWQHYCHYKAHYCFKKWQNVFGGMVGLFFLRLSQISARLNFALNGGIDVSPIAEVGKGLFLTNPCGVVIGGNSKLGENVIIHQQVVIGDKNGSFPVIGNNVHIYSAAHILGGITIGDNAVIGAMTLVIKDVLPNTVVCGIPGKVIKTIAK